jgi:mRNA interferase RelE/StbE
VSYAVQLAPAVVRQLRKLPSGARRRIQAAIELLAESPRPPGAKKLSGSSGDWRVRTGDYRIFYEIQDAQLIVLVLAMGHRREIYKH